METKKDGEFLTIAKYARIYDLSEHYVREMCRANQMPKNHEIMKVGETGQTRIFIPDGVIESKQLEKENATLKKKLEEIINIIV